MGETLAEQLSAPFRVSKGRGFRLADYSPKDRAGIKDKDKAHEVLQMGIDNESEFDGQGGSSQSNRLVGDISVTVAQRLPNGNLLVRGQKWIAINQGREYVRIQGIVRPIVCDVADSQAIERLAKSSLEEFGAIDTLINVAGINRRMPAVELTLDDYDTIMNINLRGAFSLSLAIGKSMLERGQGSQN